VPVNLSYHIGSCVVKMLDLIESKGVDVNKNEFKVIDGLV
jgi:hypothetical protein